MYSNICKGSNNNKICMMGIISKLCNERYYSSCLCFFDESIVLDIKLVSFWCITSDYVALYIYIYIYIYIFPWYSCGESDCKITGKWLIVGRSRLFWHLWRLSMLENHTNSHSVELIICEWVKWHCSSWGNGFCVLWSETSLLLIMYNYVEDFICSRYGFFIYLSVIESQ